LFLVEQDKNPLEIELVACYAYDRKKYVHKTIQLGEGLVGQAVQEADTIYLTDVPANYVQITSGLGQATPTALLIVPLKLNDTVLGVIELAFFQPLETYQITLVEKLAENMASAVASARCRSRPKSCWYCLSSKLKKCGPPKRRCARIWKNWKQPRKKCAARVKRWKGY
jgi:GAF domain-containing protein